MHSIIQGVLIPGGRSLKRDRQSVFFHSREPDVRQSRSGKKVQYNLDKPRITVYKIAWRIHRNTVYWCNLKIAQRKGLQFYQNTVARTRSFLPAICIEKSGLYEDWQGFLLQSTPIPKVTASRHGRHDPSNLEAGKIRRPSKRTERQVQGKLVAHISKTHLTNILKKITGLSTMKLVVVTLITEFKVYLTQQSKKKIIIARKS